MSSVACINIPSDALFHTASSSSATDALWRLDRGLVLLNPERTNPAPNSLLVSSLLALLTGGIRYPLWYRTDSKQSLNRLMKGARFLNNP